MNFEPIQSSTNIAVTHPPILPNNEKNLGNTIPLLKSIDKKNVFSVANSIVKKAPQVNVNKNGFVEGLGVVKDQAKQLENYGKLKKVNALILHRTAGKSYNTPKGTLGAHFYINKGGEIYQTASLNKVTQHVGKIKSKCMEAKSCTPEDKKFYKKLGFKPALINKHESLKDYPNRYPKSIDSVGIEVVGQYDSKTKTWEPVTEKQVESLKKLLPFLEKHFKLDKNTSYYNHEDISWKTAGEGKTVAEAIKE